MDTEKIIQDVENGQYLKLARWWRSFVYLL